VAFSQDDYARRLALGPARAKYERALALHGSGSPPAVAAAVALAGALMDNQEWTEATALLERAHATVASHLGPHSPQALGVLTRLTAALLGQGETRQARTALRHLLADHGGPVAGFRPPGVTKSEIAAGQALTAYLWLGKPVGDGLLRPLDDEPAPATAATGDNSSSADGQTRLRPAADLPGASGDHG
jgi:hypothetical protein